MKSFLFKCEPPTRSRFARSTIVLMCVAPRRLVHSHSFRDGRRYAAWIRLIALLNEMTESNEARADALIDVPRQ